VSKSTKARLKVNASIEKEKEQKVAWLLGELQIKEN
jgi:hypothetical protein